MDKLKLSICIPTYNRAPYLEKCLSSIFNQIDENLSVEIIVSDNCSTDNTSEIVCKYADKSNFKVYRQVENLGAVRNVLKLVKEYSSAEFCWIIGDDDYLKSGAIKSVISILQNHNDIDFIFAKVDGYTFEEKIKEKVSTPVGYEIFENLEPLLLPPYSDLFLGEIMAGIFRRNIWLNYKKIYDDINYEYLTTLETSYPHCVIYANEFLKKKSMYISTPLIYADSRARGWWDIVGYILIEHMGSLLELYKKNGLNKKVFAKCKTHYIKITIGYFVKFIFNKKAKNRNDISYKKYLVTLLQNPVSIIEVFISIVKKKFTR
jgi:glycosyltransferase involved in cell wall biosynthesis